MRFGVYSKKLVSLRNRIIKVKIMVCMAIMNKPNIFNYNDYRLFLRDHFNYLKTVNSRFSFRFCSQRLKTSDSYLKLVLAGRRHLSMNKLIPLCTLFKIHSEERDCFITLFMKSTAKDEGIKDYYNVLLNLFKTNPQKPKPSHSSKELIFNDWLMMALDSLVKLKDFKNDIDWMHHKLGGLPLQKQDIKLALEKMFKNGSLIEKNGKILPGEFVYIEAIPNKKNTFAVYEIGQRRAIQSLKELDKFGDCHYHMMCLALTKEEAQRIKTMLHEFRNKTIDISKMSKAPTRIYFMSNNFFLISDPD